MNLKPAPEFEAWLDRMGMLDEQGRLLEQPPSKRLLAP
jgi:ethanolamine ammonia-lyase large subunit